MKYKNIFLIILSVTISLKSSGATYYLNLEKSISIAKEMSYDMKSLKEDLNIAKYELKYALSGLKTHVNLDLTLPNYTKTVTSFEDTAGIYFYSKDQLYGIGQLNISQPLITNGRVYMYANLENTDNYNDNKRLMNMSTRIGITQPLDAFYGYNETKSSIKKARLNYEETQKSLKREELTLNYNVSRYYYSLLSLSKSEEIAKMNLERQKEAYEIAKNKYNSGLIREVDALQMEVDLAEAKNNYDLSVISTNSAMNEFKQEIGLEIEDSVVLDTALRYKVVLVDPKEAVHYAMENRLEIREQEIQVEINKMNLQKQKAAGMISSNITAYYQRSGVSSRKFKKKTEGYGKSMDMAFKDFRDRPENYGVALTVSIPIIDWGENKAAVKAARSRLRKTILKEDDVKRGIEMEVLDLVNEVNSGLKRLQLLEKSLKVAEKSFSITLSRFSDGDIDSQDLSLERERLNTAYKSHLSAYITYQLSLSDLTRKTFYDFANGRSVK